ncbi:MAG TPA: peptidase M17, partial [Flavobacteriales bacterium]|nr:peptidase M17 [Flavobacteriales bacterium]
MLDLTRRTRPAAAKDTLVVLTDKARLREVDIERADRQYLLEQLKEGNGPAICDISGRLVMVHQVEKGDRASQLEAARRAGAKMAARLNLARRKEAQLLGLCDDGEAVLALAEGVALANYQFRKYRSDDKQAHTLSKLNVVAPAVKPAELEELSDLVEATGIARDLVNEPLSFLTATQLSSELKNMARNSGFKLTVFDKAQIEALAMGGLLGVNRGSPDPPTFNILEWKPKNAVNKAPIVLVGKGVVYDTGGLSLKPTPHSMDYMKCDMAGAAAVAGALYAVAKRKLPLHVVGLIPATDNRPG